jgi:hypothetical protein
MLAVFQGLSFLFMAMLLYVALRREWLTAAALFALWSVLAGMRFGWVNGVVLAGTWTVIGLRFGLLATVAMFFAMLVAGGLPLTLDFTAWYAGPVHLVSVALVVLATIAFYASLGGRPLLRAELLER